LFYNNFNKKILQKFVHLSNKGFGGSLHFFFFKLESRLDSIILRSNMANKFFIRNFIKNGFVTVNNLKITYLNYITKVNDIISFNQKKRTLVFSLLRGAVKLKRFFAQPPFYLEINYRTLCITLIPSLIDPQFIAYPFRPEDNHLFMVCIPFYGDGRF
jgi:ribosomal protein S4